MPLLKQRKRASDLLEQDLREQMEKGLLKPGDRIRPEREIIRTYKLSRGTARKVLLKLTQEGLICRKGKAGTIVSAKAKGLQRKKETMEKIIFGYLPSIEYSDITVFTSFAYGADIYQGMVSEALKDDCRIDVQIGAMFKKQLSLLANHKTEPTDGVIMAGTGLESLFPLLDKAGIPFVLVDYPVSDGEVNSVFPDNVGGGHMAAKYLIDQGHRAPCFVYPLFGNETFMQKGIKGRLLGYQEALDECRIRFNKHRVLGLSIDPYFRLRTKSEDTLYDFLLRQSQRPISIFAAAECIVPEIYRVAIKAKYSIPRDVSIIGFDGIAIGEMLQPPLTTIAMDRLQMGKFAFQRLKTLIKNEDRSPVNQILPVKLIVRASTQERTKR